MQIDVNLWAFLSLVIVVALALGSGYLLGMWHCSARYVRMEANRYKISDDVLKYGREEMLKHVRAPGQ